MLYIVEKFNSDNSMIFDKKKSLWGNNTCKQGKSIGNLVFQQICNVKNCYYHEFSFEKKSNSIYRDVIPHQYF